MFNLGNIAVVYKSNYGAARSYAIYIAKTLGADLYDLRRIKEFDFSRYDTVVFGGGLYAGKVNGLHFLSSHALELAGKKLCVYTTGISDPTIDTNVERTEKTVKKALPSLIAEATRVFCFRGGIDYDELSFSHRAMMSLLHRVIARKRPENLSPDERTILDTYGKAVDFTDMTAADPLVAYIKGA